MICHWVFLALYKYLETASYKDPKTIIFWILYCLSDSAPGPLIKRFCKSMMKTVSRRTCPGTYSLTPKSSLTGPLLTYEKTETQIISDPCMPLWQYQDEISYLPIPIPVFPPFQSFHVLSMSGSNCLLQQSFWLINKLKLEWVQAIQVSPFRISTSKKDDGAPLKRGN